MEEKNKRRRQYIDIVIIIIILLILLLLNLSCEYRMGDVGSNSNVVNGESAISDLVLNIVKVKPNTKSTDKLVPQLESTLKAAINDKNKCIDSSGNIICQVYRVSLFNSGTGSINIQGIIMFDNIKEMPNLRWKLIDNDKSISNNTGVKASSNEVKFDDEIKIKPKGKKDIYFVVWINETGVRQEDRGVYKATITYTDSSGMGLSSTFTQ